MKCTEFEEIEINSFDGVENGYDEPTVILEENPNEGLEVEEELNEDDEEEKNVVGPLELPENWADGKFEININRCEGCHLHFAYSWHAEDEYVNMFNDIGDAILGTFPNVNIVGNYELPDHLEEFEVYVRGLGFKSQRDGLDRFFLYRKS